MLRNRVSTVGLIIIASIIIAFVLTVIYGTINYELALEFQTMADSVLTVAVNVLYIVGTGMIVLGSILITMRYVKAKLENPFKPFGGLPRARYLTVSLEIFIGAEIIKAVVVRTVEEFLLLFFVIASRGLFSLILYLERRWHGSEQKSEAASAESEIDCGVAKEKPLGLEQKSEAASAASEKK
jgi:hypothetical protein